MTEFPAPAELADGQDRERAVTTFDRNVVVTAGAGTGKTSLLVDRLIHLLVREPEPLKITEIVALTFTNKAANEMKMRLRERLQSYLDVHLDRVPAGSDARRSHQEVGSLIQRYRLTKDQIDARAREAMRQIERSEIGTLHSFAAALLRLHPLEAGLDPQFREDDGFRFERHFEESWSVWLGRELSAQGERKEDWKRALRRIPLEGLSGLAFTLCSESVRLDRLVELAGEPGVPQPVRVWLEGLEQKANRLIGLHPAQRHQIERLTRASLRVVREILQNGEIGAGMLEEEKALLAEKRPAKVKGWGPEELQQAEELARVAGRLCRVDGGLTRLLCELLVPFARRCRESFVGEGFVSFDGLLVRARDLLRDHVAVREEIKRQFKAVLIDEFQDTDPIQYEILLYLTEQQGRSAADWRGVRLTPGKVFVVGDPKQSIYAFRRADIEAYLAIVQDFIKAQDGIECRLTTNFRSHDRILNVINGLFERLIRPRQGLQPSYVAINPPGPAGEDPAVALPFRGVEIRRADVQDGESTADLARRVEGEGLGRWLQEEVLGKAEVLDRDRQRRFVRPGDVAILLRTLTRVHQYLEPLRRRKIPYVVEGERHFYAMQEIIEFVNILRAVENPYDRSALVGILRSPVGGLTDAEIYELHRRGLLSYGTVGRGREAPKSGVPPQVKGLYEILYRLHSEVLMLPLGEAIFHIFASLPVRELAALSFNGEQAVANLEKVRQEVELMGREGSGTLKEVISMLQRRVSAVKEEGESVLAEENLDAVRVLSIHKAKGLEFPVVVLAGCHTSVDHRDDGPEAAYDWISDLVGLRVNDLWSPAGIFLSEKKRVREEEEQSRVLYVGATRARERLVISCAGTGRKSGGSFLSVLERAVGDPPFPWGSKLVAVGNGQVQLTLVSEALEAPRRTPVEREEEPPGNDLESSVGLWKRRADRYDEINRKPLFLSPTLLKKKDEEFGKGTPRKGPGKRAAEKPLLVGELAHRFLQQWDFSLRPQAFVERLAALVASSAQADADRHAIAQELEGIFTVFFSSPAYEELRASRILGREVPLLIPWNGHVMEGVMDVVYEKAGDLYVADYKTDRVPREDLSRVMESYHHQAEVYSHAVRTSLQRDVAGFKLIFLRLGEAVRVL